MELKVKDLVSSIDLSKPEVFLPLYESVVNSIISLDKVTREEKLIEIFIERSKGEFATDLYGRGVTTIQNITIIDNGQGFTEENYTSFKSPYGDLNRKKYGCKGVGRFTILALFEKMEITSIYEENGKWWRRSFNFDVENEITEEELVEIEMTNPQTKVVLKNCNNKELQPCTVRNAEEIAKGIMEHLL